MTCGASVNLAVSKRYRKWRCCRHRNFRRQRVVHSAPLGGCSTSAAIDFSDQTFPYDPSVQAALFRVGRIDCRVRPFSWQKRRVLGQPFRQSLTPPTKAFLAGTLAGKTIEGFFLCLPARHHDRTRTASTPRNPVVCTEQIVLTKLDFRTFQTLIFSVSFSHIFGEGGAEKKQTNKQTCI